MWVVDNSWITVPSPFPCSHLSCCWHDRISCFCWHVVLKLQALTLDRGNHWPGGPVNQKIHWPPKKPTGPPKTCNDPNMLSRREFISCIMSKYFVELSTTRVSPPLSPSLSLSPLLSLSLSACCMACLDAKNDGEARLHLRSTDHDLLYVCIVTDA